MNSSFLISLISLFILLMGCGGASSGATTATNAQPTASVAFKGEECHGVWQRPKDAKGRELPWDSTEGVGGAPWAKGPALPAGKREQLVLGLICFDSIASDDVFKRYVAYDDRRFDANDAAILLDACVESGTCTSDEMTAGLLAWHAKQLELTRISAASKKLDISQEARDAFVDRTLKNAAKLDAFLATVAPAERAYAVDIPVHVHELAAAYVKDHAEEYGRLDRILDQPTVTALVVLRSDAAARCGTPEKCSVDPLYREVTRALVHAYVAANRPLEAKAAALSVGSSHVGRARTASRVWGAQSAYRKLHPEVKAPPPVTEEADDEAASSAGVDVIEGGVASVASAGKGSTKISFKDAGMGERCKETAEVDGFDGAIEQTLVLYKKACADVPPAKNVAVLVPDAEATGIKPGMTVVVAASGTADARKGEIVRVASNGKVIQMGPDKFLQASGDPLKGQP
jgi:hypothetical protein